MNYPVPFFVTSTKDNYVHPGHARKMAKKFEAAKCVSSFDLKHGACQGASHAPAHSHPAPLFVLAPIELRKKGK
jgi:prolyl oligopeptidase PreP (S9A serine peptidase family)